MSLPYKLSRLALKDIDSIWEYTLKNWSINQAETYYLKIFEGIKIVCDHPDIGKSISPVKKNHRALLVGSHMIVYKFENEIIYVDRILHQSMDIDSLL